MSTELIIDVTDATFEAEVLKSELPVLVDVWAPWCGPCRAIAPVITEVANIYDKTLKVVKVNADSNPKILGMFGINGIPALLFFKSGKLEEEIRGFVAADTIKRYVNVITA